jgi:hypothetical protein
MEKQAEMNSSRTPETLPMVEPKDTELKDPTEEEITM